MHHKNKINRKRTFVFKPQRFFLWDKDLLDVYIVEESYE
jgi:hypothetical protein